MLADGMCVLLKKLECVGEFLEQFFLADLYQNYLELLIKRHIPVPHSRLTKLASLWVESGNLF